MFKPQADNPYALSATIGGSGNPSAMSLLLKPSTPVTSAVTVSQSGNPYFHPSFSRSVSKLPRLGSSKVTNFRVAWRI